MKKRTEISRESYEKISKVRTYETVKEIVESLKNRPSEAEIKKDYDKLVKGNSKYF